MSEKLKPVVSVTFVANAAGLAGYVTTGKGGNQADSITPARLLPDGSWAPVDKERSEGLGIKRRVGPATSQHVESYFVPWSNVAALKFEEPAK